MKMEMLRLRSQRTMPKVYSESTQEKRLTEVVAYNVRQCLCSEHDVNRLNLPQTLEKPVEKFVDTFSGDYIADLCEN